MQSFQEEYLNKIIIPHRIIRIIGQISEYKGKQELYKKQKLEALENLRKVAVIQSTEGITAFESRIVNVSDKILSSYQGENKTEIILNAIDNFIGNFSLSDIFEISPKVSEELIKKVLKKLNKEGKIEPISKGRYAKWRKI